MAQGLSQAEFAALLSTHGEQMHQQTVQKIEKGTRPLKFAEALRVAAALKISVDDLVVGDTTADFVATQVRNMSAVVSLVQELDDLAARFADTLLQIAIDLAVELERQPGPTDMTDAAGTEIAQRAREILSQNWGKYLNVTIMDELRRQPYAVSLRPEYEASTYSEVLELISRQRLRWSKLDESET